MTAKTDLLAKLHLEDAFKDFVPVPNTKLFGWNGTGPIFSGVVSDTKPKVIVEVGSWMGESSTTLARAVKDQGLDAVVVCIDTWLGSAEHWQELDLRKHLELENGYPTFYRRFLTNVINKDVQDVIIPLPVPSTIGAAILKHAGITADAIYIDGSHTQKDVYNDLEAFWEIAAPSAILFGDDADWSSVITAVKAFSAEIGAPYALHGQINWLFRKRAD